MVWYLTLQILAVEPWMIIFIWIKLLIGVKRRNTKKKGIQQQPQNINFSSKFTINFDPPLWILKRRRILYIICYVKQEWDLFTKHPFEPAKKMGEGCSDENGGWWECQWSTKCPLTNPGRQNIVTHCNECIMLLPYLVVIPQGTETDMRKFGKECSTGIQQQYCPTSIWLAVSKAYVRPEGRSLLWLIMMSLRTSVVALAS